MAASGETDTKSAVVAGAASAARRSVSPEESQRRRAWGNEWGSHARETAARLERERQAA